jgi:hypothetical protein
MLETGLMAGPKEFRQEERVTSRACALTIVIGVAFAATDTGVTTDFPSRPIRVIED